MFLGWVYGTASHCFDSPMQVTLQNLSWSESALPCGSYPLRPPRNIVGGDGVSRYVPLLELQFVFQNCTILQSHIAIREFKVS